MKKKLLWNMNNNLDDAVVVFIDGKYTSAFNTKNQAENWIEEKFGFAYWSEVIMDIDEIKKVLNGMTSFTEIYKLFLFQFLQLSFYLQE